MSIKADILKAKAVHGDHVATHKCSTLKPCKERAELWLEYMDVARRWGREPDDDARQRAHYERNVRPAAA